MFSRSGMAVLIVLAAAALPAVAAVTSDVLPPGDSVEGWRMRGPVRRYSPRKLYEYIDGNADLFLSYGFVGLAVGDYEPAKGGVDRAGPEPEVAWVSVDVYNMATPIQAFGIFAAEMPAGAKTVSLGTQGYQSNGLTAFWKGPYYVKVSLVEGKDQQAAQLLAEVSAGRIAAGEAMPVELQRLPSEGRIAGSERYVKKGALGQSFLRETVSAQYKLGDSVGTLYTSDLRARGPSLAAAHKLARFYAQAGASLAAAPAGLARQAFAVRDDSSGEMVITTVGKFVVIAASEKAPRDQVAELAKAGAAAASAAALPPAAGSAAAACPTATGQGAACPIDGSCAAGAAPAH